MRIQPKRGAKHYNKKTVDVCVKPSPPYCDKSDGQCESCPYSRKVPATELMQQILDAAKVYYG